MMRKINDLRNHPVQWPASIYNELRRPWIISSHHRTRLEHGVYSIITSPLMAMDCSAVVDGFSRNGHQSTTPRFQSIEIHKWPLVDRLYRQREVVEVFHGRLIDAVRFHAQQLL